MKAGLRSCHPRDPVLATCGFRHAVEPDVVVTVDAASLLARVRGPAGADPSGAPVSLRETSLGQNRLRPARRRKRACGAAQTNRADRRSGANCGPRSLQAPKRSRQHRHQRCCFRRGRVTLGPARDGRRDLRGSTGISSAIPRAPQRAVAVLKYAGFDPSGVAGEPARDAVAQRFRPVSSARVLRPGSAAPRRSGTRRAVGGNPACVAPLASSHNRTRLNGVCATATAGCATGEPEGSAQLSPDTCIVVTALIDGGDLSGRGHGRLPASASSGASSGIPIDATLLVLATQKRGRLATWHPPASERQRRHPSRGSSQRSTTLRAQTRGFFATASSASSANSGAPPS